MKIEKFEIRNFRNIQFAECLNIPNLMVICGPNGCGKSALLEAIILAKEIFSSYKGSIDRKRLRNVVSANSSKAEITLDLKFNEEDVSLFHEKYQEYIPSYVQLYVEIDKNGKTDYRITHDLKGIKNLLKHYTSDTIKPGFIDYISADRRHIKIEVNKWNPDDFSDGNIKDTLVEEENKFRLTKFYLASLKMKDLQDLQSSLGNGEPIYKDSLQNLKKLFNSFFSPMKFEDVDISKSPFEFKISTPTGIIDIDDLSSGEKEIFNVFVHFQQLNPINSIILFDEIDAHLHPEFAKRYFQELIKLSDKNQVILTTHSPEIMMFAPKNSLYTIMKYSPDEKTNQLRPIATEDDELYDALTSLMGERGYLSFNNKIVFIEGVEVSADKLVYEHFFPRDNYNITFVPAGTSYLITKIAEQVNKLLSSSIPFQEYFSIIDGDIERYGEDFSASERLFRLPVYHIENFLLNSELILDVITIFLGKKCPYKNASEVENELIKLISSDQHLNPYTKALFNDNLTKIAIKTSNSILKRISYNPPSIKTFDELKEDVKRILEKSIKDGTWRKKCKGRDILKSFCSLHSINYQHFRNSLIDKMEAPPKELEAIIQKIISN